jgi:hypothetical protein
MKAAVGEPVQTAGPHDESLRAALTVLWDAAPGTLATLRRCAEPLTGVRAVDYEDTPDATEGAFWRDWRHLVREGGLEWLVPEPASLGGFGFQRRHALFNHDTLKLYEALIALKFSAVLPADRATATPIIWEIGGGWGGLAYQFKRLFPRATYVMTAPPESFLLSAVYLHTLFPKACCRFYADMPADELWRDLDHADFVFVPEQALASLGAVRFDLTIDLMTLELMTDERARAHVGQAYACGCPYFYSVAPAQRSAPGLLDVGSHIERWYWPHVIPVPRMREGQAMVGGFGPRPGLPGGVPHSHLIGWRRIQA